MTVKLMATTRERTVINRSYFNARAERSRKAIDVVFVADEAAADLTYIHQVGD